MGLLIIVIGNAVPTHRCCSAAQLKETKMFAKTMFVLDRTVMSFALLLAAAPFLAIAAGAL